MLFVGISKGRCPRCGSNNRVIEYSGEENCLLCSYSFTCPGRAPGEVERHKHSKGARPASVKDFSGRRRHN